MSVTGYIYIYDLYWFCIVENGLTYCTFSETLLWLLMNFCCRSYDPHFAVKMIFVYKVLYIVTVVS